MPFCPRCGQEVSAETKYCPRCGSQIEYVSPVEMSPRREGVVEHLRYAIEKSKENPVIFIPTTISAIISLILMRAMDYWIDKYDLFNNLYDLLGIETDIIPIIYGIPTEALSWEIIITTITIVLILSSILDGILTISTLHMSSEAVKGNDPNLKISLSYALSSILRFITAGFAILTFFGIFAGSIVLFSVIMETYSLELGLIGIFLVSIIILIVSYLGSPFAIIMVVEDIGFGQSISKAFVFSRRRLWTYLGLIILIGIIASTISLVPYLGWILTSIPAVIGNLAIIDLYIEYTKDITF